MRTVRSVVAMAFLLGGWGGLLWAQAPKDEHADHHPEKAAEPAPPANAPAQPSLGMPESMWLRCRMFLQMKVNPTNPAALVAVKDQLGLSQEQIDRLQQILKRSEEEARAVLTPEQQQKLAPLANLPNNCREMHRQMMQRMRSPRGGPGPGGQGGGGMMCPMMQMMESPDAPQPPNSPSPQK